MTDTPTPPAMTPEQRAELVARLNSIEGMPFDLTLCYNGVRLEAADQLEANARRIARVPAMEAEIIRLTARVAELEAALKPLADMAERYDPDDGDDGQLECWSGLAVPKIHHLRTARAALSTPTEEPKT